MHAWLFVARRSSSSSCGAGPHRSRLLRRKGNGNGVHGRPPLCRRDQPCARQLLKGAERERAREVGRRVRADVSLEMRAHCDHCERAAARRDATGRAKRNSPPLVGFSCSCDWRHLRSDEQKRWKGKKGRGGVEWCVATTWRANNERGKQSKAKKDGRERKQWARGEKQWWQEGKEVRREASGSGVGVAQRPKASELSSVCDCRWRVRQELQSGLQGVPQPGGEGAIAGGGVEHVLPNGADRRSGWAGRRRGGGGAAERAQERVRCRDGLQRQTGEFCRVLAVAEGERLDAATGGRIARQA